MRSLFLYSIIICFVYANIKTYLENKKKFASIFDSINGINKKIENVEVFINRKRVQFKNDKQFINRTKSLDIDNT
jgi:hypothetical protein